MTLIQPHYLTLITIMTYPHRNQPLVNHRHRRRKLAHFISVYRINKETKPPINHHFLLTLIRPQRKVHFRLAVIFRPQHQQQLLPKNHKPH